MSKCLEHVRETNQYPRLTVKGLIVQSTKGDSDGQKQRFDWCDAVVDAAIISGVTFFSTLGGGAVAGISAVHTVEAATVAAFSQFFVFLALKRGLIQAKQAQP